MSLVKLVFRVLAAILKDIPQLFFCKLVIYWNFFFWKSHFDFARRKRETANWVFNRQKHFYEIGNIYLNQDRLGSIVAIGINIFVHVEVNS